MLTFFRPKREIKREDNQNQQNNFTEAKLHLIKGYV